MILRRLRHSMTAGCLSLLVVGCTSQATTDMSAEPPDLSSEAVDMSVADFARSPDAEVPPPDLLGSVDSSTPPGLPPPPSSFSWIGGMTARDTMAGGLNAQLGGASFSQADPGMPASTATSVGPCVVFNMTGMAPSNDYLGPIYITDAVGTIKLSCSGSGCDGEQSTNPTMWLPGDVLTFTADSGTFGGFAVSVTMPDVASFVPVGVSGTYPRSADLPLSWTGGTKSIVVSIGPGIASASYVSMVCTYSAADHQGVVPSAALGLMPDGAYTLEFSVTSSVSFNAGGAYLTVAATSDNGSEVNISDIVLVQ
jgi:hypothetical protein